MYTQSADVVTMLNPLALATRSLTVPDVGTVNVLLVLSVRCLLHVPPVKPHESSVPADISASIMYREPVLPLTKARPCRPRSECPRTLWRSRPWRAGPGWTLTGRRRVPSSSLKSWIWSSPAVMDRRVRWDKGGKMQRWRQRSREGEASTCAALDVCACEYLGSTARSTNASGARAASMVTIEARRALSACARAIPADTRRWRACV